MTASLNTINPDRPKRVVIVLSNPSVSEQTGWPIGFWWSELTHPYWELTGHGYRVDIASPDGGALDADSWSDPRDDSRYWADDLISLGFITSPEHMGLVKASKQSSRVGSGSARCSRVQRCLARPASTSRRARRACGAPVAQRKCYVDGSRSQIRSRPNHWKQAALLVSFVCNVIGRTARPADHFERSAG